MNESATDNYGRPRRLFVDRLASMSDADLRDACNQHIWLSAYANNNHRSDYHWQADACYDEAKSRDKLYIYDQEHKKLVAAAS